MLEAADHAALLVVFEPHFPDSLLEPMVFLQGGDLDDHVDVVGGPEFRRRLIGDPQLDRGSTDEDDLGKQVAEVFGCELQHPDIFEVHAGAGSPKRRLSSSTASARSRALPIRIASNKASASPSCGSRLATSGTTGWRGSSAMPRTLPRAWGQTGGLSPDEERRSASGGAAHAVGMPRASPCRTAGNTYLAP